jgi:hypothetical protein
MEVSGQLHIPAALSLGKDTLASSEQRLDGPQGWSGNCAPAGTEHLNLKHFTFCRSCKTGNLNRIEQSHCLDSETRYSVQDIVQRMLTSFSLKYLIVPQTLLLHEDF